MQLSYYAALTRPSSIDIIIIITIALLNARKKSNTNNNNNNGNFIQRRRSYCLLSIASSAFRALCPRKDAWILVAALCNSGSAKSTSNSWSRSTSCTQQFNGYVKMGVVNSHRYHNIHGWVSVINEHTSYQKVICN